MRIGLFLWAICWVKVLQSQPDFHDHMYLNSWLADSVVQHTNRADYNLKGPVKSILYKELRVVPFLPSTFPNDHPEASWDTLTLTTVEHTHGVHPNIDSIGFSPNGELTYITGMTANVLRNNRKGYPTIVKFTDGTIDKYTFGRSGRIASKLTYSKMEELLETHLYSYGEQKVVVLTFGRKKSLKDHPYQVLTYYYNNDGTLRRRSYCIDFTEYSIDSVPSACFIIEEIYEYDDKLQLVLVKEFSEENYNYYISSYSNEKLDSLLLISIYKDTYYCYNELGQLIELKSKLNSDNSTGESRVEKDSLGRVIYDPGYGWIIRYEYNSHGDVSKQLHFQMLSDTTIKEHQTLEYTYQYDKFGNPVRTMLKSINHGKTKSNHQDVSLYYIRYTQYEYY